MARKNVIYKGRINSERNGVTPLRGQGLSQSRSIRLKGGRQLVVKHRLPAGSAVKFSFPQVKEKSTKYNYLAELVMD